MQLSAAQQKAAFAQSPRVAVIAGPGTGKTRTMVARVQFLLENKVAQKAIAVATFTQKAALEAESRLSIHHEASPVSVGTLHALALQEIKAHQEELGLPPFRVGSDQELAAIRKDIARHLPPQVSAPDLEAHLSRATNRETWSHEGEYLSEYAEAFEQAYTAAKAESGLLDFDDLMVLWSSLVKIHRPFQHILVDEFQDLTPIQTRILEDLSQEAALWVAGDPDQAIYGFRGAPSDGFEGFIQRGQTEVLSLTDSYRLPPGVARLASRLSNHRPLQSVQSTDKERIRLCRFDSDQDELNSICKMLVDDRNRGLPLSEQAILTRKQQDCERIRAGLQNKSIEGVWVGTVHAAKGREWTSVIVPGLNEGRFPATFRRADEVEERRLLYVAITRTKERLVLSYVQTTRSGRYLERSRFLDELGLTSA